MWDVTRGKPAGPGAGPWSLAAFRRAALGGPPIVGRAIDRPQRDAFAVRLAADGGDRTLKLDAHDAGRRVALRELPQLPIGEPGRFLCASQFESADELDQCIGRHPEATDGVRGTANRETEAEMDGHVPHTFAELVASDPILRADARHGLEADGQGDHGLMQRPCQEVLSPLSEKE